MTTPPEPWTSRTLEERHLDRVLSPNKRASGLPGEPMKDPGTKRTKDAKRTDRRRRNAVAKKSRKQNR